jgi:hypothetical protein
MTVEAGREWAKALWLGTTSPRWPLCVWQSSQAEGTGRHGRACGCDAVGRMCTCAEEQSGIERQWRREEEGGVWKTARRQVVWHGVVGFLMSERMGEMPQW